MVKRGRPKGLLGRKYDLPSEERKITDEDKRKFRAKFGEAMPEWYKKILLQNKQATNKSMARRAKAQEKRDLKAELKRNKAKWKKYELELKKQRKK
jgi:hypothetical protein